jgi:hypothetical protein
VRPSPLTPLRAFSFSMRPVVVVLFNAYDWLMHSRGGDLVSLCLQCSWMHYYLLENYGRPRTLLTMVPYVLNFFLLIIYSCHLLRLSTLLYSSTYLLIAHNFPPFLYLCFTLVTQCSVLIVPSSRMGTTSLLLSYVTGFIVELFFVRKVYLCA